MKKLIYLEDAVDALERKKDKNAKGYIGGFYNKIIQNDIDTLMQMPSAHPEQLNEQLEQLKRADTLLTATHDLLQKQYKNIYVLNLLAETINYDEAECDGNCLMEDIEAWMTERGIYHDDDE